MLLRHSAAPSEACATAVIGGEVVQAGQILVPATDPSDIAEVQAPQGASSEPVVARCRRASSGRTGEHVMQGPAERAAAAEKVRHEQSAAAAAARREQMAAAAEARMRALALASQKQKLWCRHLAASLLMPQAMFRNQHLMSVTQQTL